PEFVQHGAIAALKSNEYVRSKVEMVKKRLDAACKTLKEIGADFYRSDGSLYLFPTLNTRNEKALDANQFALDLLEKEHVSVTPGSVFGHRYGEYVRVTLLQSEERIREGIEKMARLL
ncbi:MAG: aminotransferase class I/II-fold pyridoxal phosphate-dependent enzyme, partial [Nitrososphaerales archaeon]